MNSQRRSVPRIVVTTLLLMVSLGCLSGAISIHPTRAAVTFTVRNTNDSGPGSLRQAILDANSLKGSDIINFDIPGSGVQTIRPLSALPVVTDKVLIDGWSQGGSAYSGPPLIEISGVNVRTPNNGLELKLCLVDCSEGATVRGLVINGFTGHGIQIFGSHNLVMGCYIGTTADGETPLPNGGSGISVGWVFNEIGGSTRGARNVISGNLRDGISLEASDNNRIVGNYIGLSASGLTAVGNGWSGISIHGSDNIIGGIANGERNVISGNNGNGIYFESTGPTLSNNRIEGNYIGVKPDGVTGGVGNGSWGITGIGWLSDNKIGGLSPQHGNVISGNGPGLYGGGGINLTAGAAFIVQNNLIGVGADRTGNLGNLGDGIRVGGFGHRIGGSLTYLGHTFSAGNVIAFNQGIGIHLDGYPSVVQNLISRNSIYSNSGLGIDLEPLGVTPNDFCDTDTGANNLQNFPTITSIVPAPNGGITINGRVNGTLPNYTVEFFDNDDCDPSGNGQGRRFLGSTITTTQLTLCRSLFGVTISNISMGQVHFVTATATSPDGSTSEFSPCFSPN